MTEKCAFLVALTVVAGSVVAGDLPLATVDFSAAKGMVKRLNGVCNGLKLTQSNNVALNEQFAALEVPEIRFHDQAGSNGGQAIVDVSRVFPLTHADADDPRNYDFKATDDYIALCRRRTKGDPIDLQQILKGHKE